MDAGLFSIFFHLLGFGLVMVLLVGGWLLHLQYLKASDDKAKLVILGSSRAVGLLSPFTIILLLVTGLGNMHVRGVGLLDESWLAVKILLFAIAAVNGIAFGIRSKKRGALAAQLTQGNAPADGKEKLAAMDKGATLFHSMQTVLLITILILTVWKPGRYGV